jgi:hypothetical protein
MLRGPAPCSCGGGCPRCGLQRKLAINEPGDAFEREADQVADQVMRMADPNPPADPLLTAKPDSMQRLQRRANDPHGPASAPPIVHEVLRSPGQPLDVGTRAFMEPRFGRDFGQVRVHSDERAAESAQAVNALAYTVGRDIALASGQYKPETTQGRRLLAHELTHVVQQGGSASNVAPPSGTNAANAMGERHGDRAASQVLSASRFGITQAAGHLQRYSHSDCSDSDLTSHIWPADGIAKQLVAKAIRVLSASPLDPAVPPLFLRYFMSSTPTVASILAVYNAIQSDFTGNAYTYECEDDCDDCAYVRSNLRYIGYSPNLHLCMNKLGGETNDCIAQVIIQSLFCSYQ